MANRIRTLQTSFVAGQLDDDLAMRQDVQLYYSGASRLVNVDPLPTGGVRRRGGSEMIAEIGCDALLIPFEYGPGENYIICVRASGDFFIIHADAQEHVATVPHTYTSAQALELGYAQSLDTVILCHLDKRVHRLQRQGSHTTWAFEDHTGNMKNLPKYDFDGAGTEVAAWDDTKGWPSSVAFYQGRSWWGNTKSLPTHIWGSNSGKGLFDFFVSTGDEPLADDAVTAALDGQTVNRVQSVWGGIDMLVMTSGGVFVQDQKPISVNNFAPLPHTSDQISRVRPVELETGVIVVEEPKYDELTGEIMNGQGVYEILFEDGMKAYGMRNLAELCPSVVKNPVDLARSRSVGNQSVSFLHVINKDGTGATLTSSRRNEITAWAQFVTAGELKQMASAGGKRFGLVKRTIAGVEKWFIERFRDDRFTDCGISQIADPAKSVWTGFDHLDGETVQVRGDNSDMGDYLVSDGTIELPYEISRIEVGLGYEWIVETMPLAMKLPDGTLVGKRNRIAKVVASIKDTEAIDINGEEAPVHKFGDIQLDGRVPAATGEARRRLRGWNKGARGDTVTLGGKRPSSATLLAVTMEVAV